MNIFADHQRVLPSPAEAWAEMRKEAREPTPMEQAEDVGGFIGGGLGGAAGIAALPSLAGALDRLPGPEWVKIPLLVGAPAAGLLAGATLGTALGRIKGLADVEHERQLAEVPEETSSVEKQAIKAVGSTSLLPRLKTLVGKGAKKTRKAAPLGAKTPMPKVAAAARVRELWEALPAAAKAGIAAAPFGAGVAGVGQYLSSRPMEGGQSREEILAQAAAEKARQLSEARGDDYSGRLTEEALKGMAGIAAANREHPLKAALLAALLGGTITGAGAAGTASLLSRMR